MERLFSTYQVAELLGVTTWVVSTWMRQGMLTYQQLPQGLVRVSERSLVSFLRAQQIDLNVLMKDIALADNADKTATADIQPTATWLQASETKLLNVESPPSRPATPAGLADTSAELPDAPRPSDEELSPAHAAQQVLQAVLRDAIGRQAQSVQFTLDGLELTLALRIDGRLIPKPHFHTRLPTGLGNEIVAHALERSQAAWPSPVSSGAMTTQSDGREVAVSVRACRIGPTTRLVLSLPCGPNRVEDLLPVGHARTLHKALDNRSGLILLGGPMDRCRRLLDAIRKRLEEAGRSVLEVPRSSPLPGEALRELPAEPERSMVDALLVEEFSGYDGVSGTLEACRRALVVVVVPEDTPSGVAAFLRRANVPAWDLARGLSAVVVLDTEGGVARAVDGTLREKIRAGDWEWGMS